MLYPAPTDARESRVWIDGCFDFAHHGHAGAMLQARQLGKELYVGVHSDDEILKNKGPTVMSLPERITAVKACKWCTEVVPDAPYVTDPDFLDKYDCKYAVHGDDITTDANGEDCYKVVKDLGRFIVVKRTPSISTTDLVGRMLLYTKNHHIRLLTLEDFQHYEATSHHDTSHTHPLLEQHRVERYKQYATDETGLNSGSGVYIHTHSKSNRTNISVHRLINSSDSVKNKATKGGIYYVSGTFDLFHPGHIELLNQIHIKAKSQNPPAAVVVGILDDITANNHKGLNYPIMSIFERSLCVLQCCYVDSIVLGAPYTNIPEYFAALEKNLGGKLSRVFNGATIDIFYETPQGSTDDLKEIKAGAFEYEKKVGIYSHIDKHLYDDISTEVIVSRVLDNRKAYEERQRKKGWKSEKEKRLEAVEKSQRA